MRKFTSLLMMLLVMSFVSVQAKKVYADLSENQTIGKGTWDAATQTFTWTASNNARMILNGLSGDLSDCTSLVLETSDYTDTYRVDFICGDETIVASSDAGTKFYSAGVKNIDLKKALGDKANLLSDVKEIRINTNSDFGSIKISKAYLVKPFSAVEFDANGVASVDFSDLVADKVTFDETTGAVTSTGSGTLALILPSEGIDMSQVKTILVDYQGDDIVQTLTVEDATNGQLFKAYTSKYKMDFGNYQTNAGHVNKLVWGFNKEGSMTIKSIKFLNEAATTGISSVVVTPQLKSDAVYNLGGMKVKNAHGIVISNGKKYVVK